MHIDEPTPCLMTCRFLAGTDFELRDPCYRKPCIIMIILNFTNFPLQGGRSRRRGGGFYLFIYFSWKEAVRWRGRDIFFTLCFTVIFFSSQVSCSRAEKRCPSHHGLHFPPCTVSGLHHPYLTVKFHLASMQTFKRLPSFEMDQLTVRINDVQANVENETVATSFAWMYFMPLKQHTLIPAALISVLTLANGGLSKVQVIHKPFFF